MNTSLESVVREALTFEAEAFDEDEHVSGADLVEWFAEWRERAKVAAPPSQKATTPSQRFRRLMSDAISALQALQDCAGGSRHSRRADPENEDILLAINNGGIQIEAGAFDVVVFKRRAKGEPSCRS